MSILHFWEHHKDALASKVLEFSERFGSKAWILEFLRTFPDLRDHILPGFVISENDLEKWSIPNLPDDFRVEEKWLIYRSTHPDDHRGYIGMLPTLYSRHQEGETYRSGYDLPNHELNLLKVYNALAYFQRNKEEPSYSWRDFSINWFHDPFWYPLSDPRMSYENEEDIPNQELSPYFYIWAHGYHIDYLQLYKALLEKVKNGEDTTDYAEKVRWIEYYQWWSYKEMIKSVQEAVGKSTRYKEPTWLRGREKTGILIQKEIPPTGKPLWGIYESPHKKWLYIITFRAPTIKSEKERKNPGETYAYSDQPATFMYDSTTGEIEDIEWDSYGRRGFLSAIIELYSKVAAKEVFWKDYSFHMEFWFMGNRPMIFQLRQFSPYQHANFTVPPEEASSSLIRGITDETWEKITIVLLWGASSKSKIDATINVWLKNRKVELRNNTPLRQRRVVTGTGWGRLDDDHWVTKILYETWGIALAGKLSWIPYRNDSDATQAYSWTIYSDGISAVIEDVKEVS